MKTITSLAVAALMAATVYAADWERNRTDAAAAFRQGKHAEAERLFRENLAIAGQRGTDEATRLTILRDMASFYCATGKYSDGEALLIAVLGMRERTLGSGHSDLVPDIDNLGRLSFAQMKLAEAEKYFRRSLEILETNSSADSLAVLPAIANVSRVIQIDPKRSAELEDLLKRIIAIREKQQGPEHQDVAPEVFRLARFYVGQKKPDLAEAAYKRVLAIMEKAFGPDDVRLSPVFENLAGVYFDQKRFTDAEASLRLSIANRERAGGPLSPDLAQVLESYGGAIFAQKRFADAEPVYARALALYELALGPDSPIVAVSLDSLAVTKASIGKYAEAEPLYKRALEIREKMTVASFNNLALVSVAQEKYGDAEPFYKLALGLLERPGLLSAATQEKQVDAARQDLHIATLENYVDLLVRTNRSASKAIAQLKTVKAAKPATARN